MDCCKSRENCKRKLVARLLVQALVRDAAMLSVVNVLASIAAFRIAGDGARWIEELVVVTAEARGAEPQKRELFWRKREVQLGESGIALHGGGIRAAHAVQLLRRCHYQCLVGVVVVGRLSNNRRGSVSELHHGWHGQQVLVKAGIKKDPVLADRAAESAPKLLLAIVRLAGGIGLLRVEIAIAQIVEAAAVPLIGA